MAGISLYSTGKLHRYLAPRQSQVALLIFSVVSYSAQASGGVWLMIRPHQQSLYDALSYVITSSFALALVRAWALLQGSYLAAKPDVEH